MVKTCEPFFQLLDEQNEYCESADYSKLKNDPFGCKNAVERVSHCYNYRTYQIKSALYNDILDNEAAKILSFISALSEAIAGFYVYTKFKEHPYPMIAASLLAHSTYMLQQVLQTYTF